jgi:putative ABC transport system permease protein
MSIPMITGRAFTASDRDQAPMVAIINQALAKRYFPNESPIGKRLAFDGTPDKPNWREIVGVVASVKNFSLEAEPKPEFYLPYDQYPPRAMTLVIRTGSDPTNIASSVRNEVRRLDKSLPIYSIKTMEQVVSESVAQQRLAALLIGVFACLALLLASVGIYGVMAYSVTQRTHEIGIRMALGAQPSNVLGLVLKQGMVLVIIGIVLGLGAALALTRVVSSLLYGVSATDPLIFASIGGLLALIALIAILIPARKATHVDPMVALRYQ